LNDFFYETVVPKEISIPAKFYCFMATRFFRADIRSCQPVFRAQVALEKSGITSGLIEIQSLFYAHFKANKIPFPVTCYTQHRYVFKVLKSDLVFLKKGYFNFLNILCASNYYLKHLQISRWDWVL
jgi:hypothetical protein